ncbi:flagellar biosynthesis regulator FlaF [Roseomonas sp. E05]|nr:flagellar biosynthesis regulator FlaF [Roseomonas sp. E05]MDJ0386508.1 flagellar biosynthesis regulator FlaF [Roseomonas sp. E05]
MEEAMLFRQVVLLLRQAREGGDPTRGRAAAEATRRLWEAVLLALHAPGCTLPPALRQGLETLGQAVMREVARPAPDYGFLADINEQVMAGLATCH